MILEGMSRENAAQVAVFTSVLSYWFAMANDGASLIVGVMCGLLPCVAFLSETNSRGSAAVAAETFWVLTALFFIISFIYVMLQVVSKVTTEDMDVLLRNTMALFCTGVTSAHLVFVCIAVGWEEAFFAAFIGAASVALFRMLGLARVKGLLALLLACALSTAGAAVVGIASNESMASAAVGFIVAGSLDASARLLGMQVFVMMVRSALFSITALHYIYAKP